MNFISSPPFILDIVKGAKHPGIHVSNDGAKKKRTKEDRYRQSAFATPATKVCPSAGAEQTATKYSGKVVAEYL
jgi:L-fucose isomerase-like protein